MDDINTNQTSVVRPTEGDMPTAAMPPTEPASGKKRKLVIAIIVAALLLLGGALALFVLQSQKNKTPEVTKQDIPLLRYGALEGPIHIFYPATGLISGEIDINQQMFEGLVRYEDQTKIVPLLATSWTNPDPSTWIFSLKQDVKFHTGRTMSAQDVKASLDHVIANNADLGTTYGGTIKSVEVVDDHQIKIVTDGPDPVLLNKLSFLYIYDTTSGKQEDPINGTGPFQIKPESTPSEQEVQMVAFDDYHGGHVSVRELHFIYYTDESKLADDLKDGKLNMGGSMFQIENVNKVKDLPQLKVKTNSVNHVGMNTLRPDSPVSDLRVRQAVYLATDPEALLKARGVEGEPFGQIVSPDIPGYNPAIKRPARDVAKAKQLLAEAGYPNGVTLEFSLVKADVTSDEFTRQLKEAGITLNLDEHSEIGSLADKVFSGDFELYYIAYSTDVLDAIDVFTTFFYESPMYNNPKVTALINEANQTNDQAKRLEVLQQISQQVMDDIVWAPISVTQITWVFDRPYVLKRDLPHAGLGVYFWQVHTTSSQ